MRDPWGKPVSIEAMRNAAAAAAWMLGVICKCVGKEGQPGGLLGRGEPPAQGRSIQKYPMENEQEVDVSTGCAAVDRGFGSQLKETSMWPQLEEDLVSAGPGDSLDPILCWPIFHQLVVRLHRAVPGTSQARSGR